MPIQTGANLKSKIAGAAAGTKAALAGETGIFKRLIAEHAEVTSLINTALESKDRAQRSALFERFKTNLTLHSEAEEKEFYALLKAQPGAEETVQIQLDEHRVMAALLTTLQNLDPSSTEWDELVNKLKTILKGHVDREENELFSASKSAITEPHAQQIESRFVERKAEEAEHLDNSEPAHTKYEMPLP